MGKKFITLIAMSVLIVFLEGATAKGMQNDKFILYIDGKEIFADCPVYTVNSTVIYPLRELCEAVGLEVVWRGEGSAEVVSGDKVIVFTAGESCYRVEWRSAQAEYPSTRTEPMDGVTEFLPKYQKLYVPLREALEAMGFKVDSRAGGNNGILALSASSQQIEDTAKGNKALQGIELYPAEYGPVRPEQAEKSVEGKENPPVPEPPKENKLLFTRSNITDSAIELSAVLPSGEQLTTSFERKSWGTWNIGGWYIGPDESRTLLAGGGTDWEYVFRAGAEKDNCSEFAGGNHGNEVLKGIKMFYGNTQEELISGPAQNTGMVRIEERTGLLYPGSSVEFAEVERTYWVYPESIILDTKYVFERDTYMSMSYVCMFPIGKQYGSRFRYTDSGNEYVTPPLGETKTTPDWNNYLGMEGTTRIEVTGDNNVSFDVWIGDKSMVDGFANSNKVFVWDLNIFSNKVYFSKYEEGANPAFIKAGTVWNYRAGWDINVR